MFVVKTKNVQCVNFLSLSLSTSLFSDSIIMIQIKNNVDFFCLISNFEIAFCLINKLFCAEDLMVENKRASEKKSHSKFFWNSSFFFVFTFSNDTLFNSTGDEEEENRKIAQWNRIESIFFGKKTDFLWILNFFF